ncbi:MAG: hypothetical protein ABGX04_08785, partial [Myxococcales bacterium]
NFNTFKSFYVASFGDVDIEFERMIVSGSPANCAWSEEPRANGHAPIASSLGCSLAHGIILAQWLNGFDLGEAGYRS